MLHSRRDFLSAAGVTVVSLAVPLSVSASDRKSQKHIVTLSFDDGFKRSSIKTAEIYEKHKLSACLNVVASGHILGPRTFPDAGLGDFGLWNELQARGHEIMPHGYEHADLPSLPLDEAKGSILRCLDVFERELTGFDRKRAVFNFPYDDSTPELETWLSPQVLAFRTLGEPINPWPRKGQTKLTCTSSESPEAAIDHQVDKLLALESGWLIYNIHGLDGEGWGPMRTSYLDRLLDRLTAIESVEILPAGRALAKYVGA
jgi:peptidoglycan/xylan/chitin deacetylase (PgdA/CDA1 family)